MKIKKSLSIVLVMLMLFSLSAASVSASNEKSEKFKENQENSIKSYMEIRKELTKSHKKDKADYYAGAYLDTDGNLVFNLVENDGEEIRKIAKASKADESKIKFRKVKHSLTSLEEIVNIANKNMVKLNIRATEIDEENNKVYIYLDSLEKSQMDVINGILNTDAVEFKKQEHKIITTGSTINNGSALTLGSGGTATFGFGAKDKSTGKIGFVVPGHLMFSAKIGDSVYSGGSKMGTISKLVCSGSTDAGFVTRADSTWKAVSTFENGGGDKWTSWVDFKYSYPQNTVIYAYGAKSKKQTGKILSNNFSFTIDNTTLTNMCKSSYKAINGDSGAPVTIPNTIEPSYQSIIGMQSASYLSDSGEWMSDSYSIFSKMHNIMDSLNVQPYYD